MKKNILILNGSPQGSKGNCAVLAQFIKKNHKDYTFKILHLAGSKSGFSNLKNQLLLIEKADALLFMTGTYWDSWGSPLQKWLEQMTPYEGSKYFMGKPAGVLVLKHSVGGKGIVSRLQGVLNTFGCVLPPMTGFVYSLVSDLAKSVKSSHGEDFWSVEDISVILKNLSLYSELNSEFKTALNTWPVDSKNPRRKWLQL